MLNSQEKKILILSGGTGILCLLISLFFIVPNYRNIKATNQRIFDLRAQMQLKYDEAKSIQKSRLKLNEARDMADKLNNKFISKGKELDLITTLENLAEKNSLKQNLSLGQNILPGDDNVPFLDLSLSLVGNFQNITKYLEELNNFEYFINITSLNFVKGGPSDNIAQKNSSNPITLNIQAKIYVQD